MVDGGHPKFLTIILREAHAEMGLLDLLHEDIFLVEEKYDRGGGKVTVVADTVEQVEGLVHSVLWEEIGRLLCYK